MTQGVMVIPTGRGWRHRLLCALVLILPALAGCDNEPEGAAQADTMPPPPVTVASPLLKRITEWYEFTGRFEAVDSVEVRARVSGYVRSIDFVDGTIVREGQVLFVIDPRPYEAAVAEARAQLTSADARVELAQAELDRAGQLVNSSTISRSTYDQRLQEKRAAEAAFAVAQADLRQAELDLEFTSVRAPITGRISDRRVDVGNLVTGDPNATLLTTIVALDPIYFVFDMSEADFLGYQRAVLEGTLPSARDDSTMIQVRLPDEPDGEVWPRLGKMNFIDNRVDPYAGTIRARAELPNPDHFIMPGQFGHLRLPGSPEYGAILIPDSAIVTDQSNKIVMAVSDEGIVEPRIIRPGPAYAGGLRIIRRGLKPDDRIVINGLMRARPGAKVDPQPGTIEPASQEAARSDVRPS